VTVLRRRVTASIEYAFATYLNLPRERDNMAVVGR
jgi:hypothetical protein